MYNSMVLGDISSMEVETCSSKLVEEILLVVVETCSSMVGVVMVKMKVVKGTCSSMAMEGISLEVEEACNSRWRRRRRR